MDHEPESLSKAPAEADSLRAERLLAARMRSRANENVVAALIDLLDDVNHAVWRPVRSRLAAMGPGVLPALRKAARGDRPRLRARARDLLAKAQRRQAVRHLIRHGARQEIDLERALYLLSHLHTANFDARPYVRALDAMGRDVRQRIEHLEPGSARLEGLATYLGTERGFRGDTTDYHHPDNSFLHRVIERRRGLPLTLSAIYLFVGRRAGIQCGATALPGHVVVQLRSGDTSMLVDPFHGGRELSRRDCLQYLTQHGHAPDPAWFRDAGDGVILLRQVRNLMNSYRTRGLVSRARELLPVLEVLGRTQVKPPEGAERLGTRGRGRTRRGSGPGQG